MGMRDVIGYATAATVLMMPPVAIHFGIKEGEDPIVSIASYGIATIVGILGCVAIINDMVDYRHDIYRIKQHTYSRKL